jgi:hypothetical protein
MNVSSFDCSVVEPAFASLRLGRPASLSRFRSTSIVALPLAAISFSTVSVWMSSVLFGLLFCSTRAAELSELLPRSKSIGSMKTIRVDLNIFVNPPILWAVPGRHKQSPMIYIWVSLKSGVFS